MLMQLISQVICILHPHRQPTVSLHTQRQRPLLMAAGFAQTNLPVPWLGTPDGPSGDAAACS